MTPPHFLALLTDRNANGYTEIIFAAFAMLGRGGFLS